MDAAAMRALVKATTALFLALTSLNLSTYKWPSHVSVQDNAEYDYIVVGAGTAGSIVANRLSEDSDVSVLLIEAGGDPHYEAEIPILFPYLCKTEMDWNFTSEDDGYSAQYHRNKYLDLPAGKCLGGSSTLHHHIYLRGDPYDYKMWAEAANDESWNWWNLLQYFKKSERLEIDEIIASGTSSFHGLDGLIGITRETQNISLKYLQAYSEMGYNVKDDLTTDDTMGFGRPFYTVNKAGIRQSSAECFLASAKTRSNLHVMKNTAVVKVLIEDNKAVGVKCSTSNGLISVKAKKEVILSAGTFNTAKILMLSGVGPKEHLESVGVEVIKDLPVGQNLQDHLAVLLFHKMEETDDVPQSVPPYYFPVPLYVGGGTYNEGQDYPDWVTMNLIARNYPAALLQLCSIIFSLNDDVCNQLAEAGTGREVLFTVFNMARPVSTGKVEIRSSDPQDPPKIYTGHLSNSTDLENNAKWIQEYIKINQSSYFKSVGAEFLYIDLPNCKDFERGTTDYWKCYVLNMMDTTFHYSSTCRMGSVLDSRLRVKGIEGLRVADASAMPNQVSGNINTAVMVIAEKAADMIKEDNKATETVESSDQSILKVTSDIVKSVISLL